jgi:hypothetical protein
VSGDPSDESAAPVVEQSGKGEQAGGDNERLGDGGIADGVGVARCPVRQKIDPDGVGHSDDLIAETLLSEPRVQEARGLRSLAGRDDNDHFSSLTGVTVLGPVACRAIPTRFVVWFR